MARRTSSISARIIFPRHPTRSSRTTGSYGDYNSDEMNVIISRINFISTVTWDVSGPELCFSPQRSCKSFVQPSHQALIIQRPPRGGFKKKAEGSEASTPVCPLVVIPGIEPQLIGDALLRPSSSSSRTFMSPNRLKTRITRKTRIGELKT